MRCECLSQSVISERFPCSATSRRGGWENKLSRRPARRKATIPGPANRPPQTLDPRGCFMKYFRAESRQRVASLDPQVRMARKSLIGCAQVAQLMAPRETKSALVWLGGLTVCGVPCGVCQFLPRFLLLPAASVGLVACAEDSLSGASRLPAICCNQRLGYRIRTSYVTAIKCIQDHPFRRS